MGEYIIQSLSELDTDAIRADIIGSGYSIGKSIVPPECITKMRDFWLMTFKNQSTLAPVIWGPYLGEPNRVHFHQSNDNCLYRAYDFLWNEPLDQYSRDIGVELSRIRNQITESDDRTGEMFASDRYGIYFTVSYYPPNDGWLHDHQDQTDERRQWHYILPITFRGLDFAGGGLHLIDRLGNDVDVEEKVEPGDVLFFDGGLTHGVTPIDCDEERNIGRMQLFSIPTFLELPEKNSRFIENVSVSQFIKGKLRPIKHRIQGIAGANTGRVDFP
jgi:hypothetical protein